MRRLALIFGMLLTLTAGVWGSALAAASAWCMHDASAPDEHDCCRAKIRKSNTHHSGSQQTSHDASHEKSTTHAPEAAESHAGMNCSGAEASSTPEIGGASLGAGGLSRVPCCAGGSGKTPATAVVVAPEQNKVKRVAGGECVGASRLFAPVTLDVSHLAPSQHAPPSSPERRHVLISVFLI